MNIQLARSEKMSGQYLDNYDTFYLSDPEVADKLESLHDNSCKNIYVGDCLDYVTATQRLALTKLLASKVRAKGTIHLHGIEFGCLYSRVGKDGLNNLLSYGVRSLENSREIVKQLLSYQFDIDSVTIQEPEYDIKATKKL